MLFGLVDLPIEYIIEELYATKSTVRVVYVTFKLKVITKNQKIPKEIKKHYMHKLI